MDLGIGKRKIAQEIVDASCPGCGRDCSVTVQMKLRYVSFFWIPVFPIGRVFAAACTYCDFKANNKGVKRMFSHTAAALRASRRTPLWSFVGLAGFVILLGIVIWLDEKNYQGDKQMVLFPKAGDLYELKEKEQDYTAWRVVAVRNDSVIINRSRLFADKSSGLGKLRERADAWDTAREQYGRAEIMQRFLDGEIIDVIRR